MLIMTVAVKSTRIYGVMPRPRICRTVGGPPGCSLFKPAGIPSIELEEIELGMDELEAIRLADMESLYHEKAAEQMNVSRQTFGRIVTSARNKVARALVEGMVIRIEGGKIEMAEKIALDRPEGRRGRFGKGRGGYGRGQGGGRRGGQSG